MDISRSGADGVRVFEGLDGGKGVDEGKRLYLCYLMLSGLLMCSSGLQMLI